MVETVINLASSYWRAPIIPHGYCRHNRCLRRDKGFDSHLKHVGICGMKSLRAFSTTMTIPVCSEGQTVALYQHVLFLNLRPS